MSERTKVRTSLTKLVASTEAEATNKAVARLENEVQRLDSKAKAQVCSPSHPPYARAIRFLCLSNPMPMLELSDAHA